MRRQRVNDRTDGITAFALRCHHACTCLSVLLHMGIELAFKFVSSQTTCGFRWISPNVYLTHLNCIIQESAQKRWHQIISEIYSFWCNLNGKNTRNPADIIVIYKCIGMVYRGTHKTTSQWNLKLLANKRKFIIGAYVDGRSHKQIGNSCTTCASWCWRPSQVTNSSKGEVRTEQVERA